ncbi:hypothetical protein [Plantactinospora mayteni]|uniref:hypothetical protein n=1 Tax=Plantactinospora mayteni TaxID=566021 RepID=UPI00194166EF|nr:hypothetical protein [Plantactinospora mayteni]
MDSATEVFVAHRNLLLTVTCELLCSAAGAEDDLPETGLRWVGTGRRRRQRQRRYQACPASAHPIGAGKVARLLAAGRWKRDAERSVEVVQINAGPGLLVRVNGEIDGVVAVRVENGYGAGAYHVRNPDGCRVWSASPP